MWVPIIASSLAMLALDAAWLWANLGRYQALVRGVQFGRSMVASRAAAAVAYALMVIGVAFIVVPGALASTLPMLQAAAKHGALFGLVVYGIFNATCAAMFSGYDVRTAVIDTVWGTTLFFVVALVALAVDQWRRTHRIRRQ